MKRYLSILLSLMLCLTAIVIPAAAEEKPVITMLKSGDNSPSEVNDVLTELGNRLGCEVHINVLPKADYSAKLNALLASGSEPDIYMVDDIKTLLELRDAGRLYNFESLLPE